MRGSRRDWLARELGRPVTGPDVTARVLARLGLEHQTEAQRRRRRRRRAARAAICAITLALAAAGTLVFLEATARPPAAPTIPAAVEHDLEQHGLRLRRAIRAIRGLVQPLRLPATPGTGPSGGPGGGTVDPNGAPDVA